MSVRLRVTLVFVAVMALVWWQPAYSATCAWARTLETASSATSRRAPACSANAATDTVAQVLDPSVVSCGRARRREWLADLSADAPRAGERGRRSTAKSTTSRFRLLATEAGGRVVVVGESLDDRDEAVASLGTLLLIGGPVRLLLTAAMRLRRHRRGAAARGADARPRRGDRGERSRRPPAGA